MISALWNGLSGVVSHNSAINVESNNIANINTIGHKSDRITFESLMYENSSGRGVSTQDITKDFTQGGIKNTGVGYDTAINGDGFFMVKSSSNGQMYYTRAGNFTMSADGTLRTLDNSFVQGIIPTVTVSSNNNSSSRMFEDKHQRFIASYIINTNNMLESINARATDYQKTATDIGVSGNNYRKAEDVIRDIEALKVDYQGKLSLYSSNTNAKSISSVAQESEVDFSSDMQLLKSEKDFISIKINNVEYKQNFEVDIQTTLNNFSNKLSKIKGITSSVDTSGVLKITSLISGAELNLTSASINNTQNIGINNIKDSLKGSGLGMLESSKNALKAQLKLANAEFLEIKTSISLSDDESLNVDNIQLKPNLIGLYDKGLGRIEIDDGLIFLTNGNNKFLIGKLTTATFSNLDALNPEGNNLYSATNKSGEAVYAGYKNKIIGKALELSNSNLGEELTSLMVFQKGFEASAKSITTADEFLNIAIKLKK